DDEAFGGDARLSVVDRTGRDRGLYRFLQIGAWHNDERIAAAKLEHGFLDDLAGFARNLTARGLAPSQRNCFDSIVLDHALDFIGTDQERLKRAGRKAGIAKDILD